MYLFNPDNDLALANFSANYTPPASAARIAEELAVLPVWYAGCDGVVCQEGSAIGGVAGIKSVADSVFEEANGVSAEGAKVIAGGELNRSFLDAMKRIFPLKAELVQFSDLALCPHDKIIPWGWNPALRRKLISNGVAGEMLPSLEALRCLRDYSNRRHAVEVLRELQTEMEVLCGESHYFTNAEELFSYLQSTQGDKVLKMPLSGSGKGLVWILGGITDKQRDWCKRVTREQGGVVAEPKLKKVKDFAMEFYLHDAEVHFAGYSMFSTSASGAYMGNALLSNARIEEKLSEYVPVELLYWLRNALMEKLPRRFPSYTGYAGVDMMVCETEDGYRLQPCVEINMRMNMGMVARIFRDRFMLAGTEGIFVVDYFKKPGSALLFHKKKQQESPLVVENGKILSGYLSLTPVTVDSRYVAYIVTDG